MTFCFDCLQCIFANGTCPKSTTNLSPMLISPRYYILSYATISVHAPIMLRQTLKVLIQTDLLFPFCRSHKEGAGSFLFHFGIACAPCHLGLGYGSVIFFHEDDLIKMISKYPVFSENWWCQGRMEGCCKKNLVAIPPLPSSSEVQIRSLDLQHANHTCK